MTGHTQEVLEGAWVAVLAMGLLFGMMRRINRYYARFTAELTLDPDQQPTVPTTVHALVLVVQVNGPVLRAVALARAMRPATLEAVTAAEDARAAEALRSDWARVGCRCRCACSTPPTKTSARPCSTTSAPSRSATPDSVVTVFIPVYVVARWWQKLLHNQSALRLKARLQQQPGVVVVSAPFHLGDREQGWLAGSAPRSTPLPGPEPPTTALNQ